MHTFKKNILLHLPTLANLNGYPILWPISLLILSLILSLFFLIIISVRLSRSS